MAASIAEIQELADQMLERLGTRIRCGPMVGGRWAPMLKFSKITPQIDYRRTHPYIPSRCGQVGFAQCANTCALRAIAACRTTLLGGHQETWDHCGAIVYSARSATSGSTRVARRAGM